MRPCQIAGCEARARSPRLAESTGTLRHSTTSRPLAAMDSATTSRARSSHSKRAATAKSPPRRRCGTWISSPAPSPLLPSASSPPRCDSRARAWTPSSTARYPSSGAATKPMPQAARLVGTSPAQARREGRSAGGTRSKVVQGAPTQLVDRHQKNNRNVMRFSQALEAQQGLDPQRDCQVHPRFRVLEIDAADLADPVEPVAEGVGVDAQLLRRLLPVSYTH